MKHSVVHFYYNYLVLRIVRLANQFSRAVETEPERRQDVRNKSRVWATFVLADAALQYVFFRVIGCRRLVVFDRFFHDYLVSFDFLGVRYDRGLLLRLMPRPGKHFLLIADYRVLHHRKPEHSLDFFADCHNRYLDLAGKTGMVVLDSTEQGASEVTKQLLAQL